MDDTNSSTFHTPAAITTALPTQIIALDHIAIAVSDLDPAIDWYVSALGFRLVEKRVTRGQSTSMISAVMTAGSAVVVLVQGLEPNSQVEKFIQVYGPGVQHIAFAVENLDEALAAVHKSGGVAETGILEGDGIRQTFLRRELGSAVRVELIERNGGTFSDASVEGLFRQIESRGLY